MPVNNDLYNHLGWWEQTSMLYSLRSLVNPWRVPYLARLVRPGWRVLDVGCGGGLLSEELARLGCHVTGIDPSPASIVEARVHAQASGLNIAYHVASAENLPFGDGQFDLVLCCDVLEHLEDWRATLPELVRNIRPGGAFAFDTINRTLFSYLVYILAAQQIPFTRFFPADTHQWGKFIRPRELSTALTGLGLRVSPFKGGAPRGSVFHAAWALLRLKLGKIHFGQFGAEIHLVETPFLGGSYIGRAIK
jgi:2-polyprenyl-6-hydroxyphenyl methylase / 3-demethylubiquinone-9 3-methyltransferase